MYLASYVKLVIKVTPHTSMCVSFEFCIVIKWRRQAGGARIQGARIQAPPRALSHHVPIMWLLNKAIFLLMLFLSHLSLARASSSEVFGSLFLCVLITWHRARHFGVQWCALCSEVEEVFRSIFLTMASKFKRELWVIVIWFRARSS